MGGGSGIAGHAAAALVEGLAAAPIGEGSREGSFSQTNKETF